MSRKKHKKRDSRNHINNFQDNNRHYSVNNPFGLNPAQLLSLLGGNDMGQLGNLLNTMGRDGFDLSGLGNMMTGFQGNNMAGSYDQYLEDDIDNKAQQKRDAIIDESFDLDIEKKLNTNLDDDNIEFFRAIRKIANPSKVELIDKIIKKYIDGEFDD